MILCASRRLALFMKSAIDWLNESIPSPYCSKLGMLKTAVEASAMWYPVTIPFVKAPRSCS